jgi:integrase
MSRSTFKKIITSPELLEQVNPKNKEIAKKFLREKNTRSSDATIKGYESDLNIFFCYNLLYNDNKFFVDIRKLELAEFFSYVCEQLQWGSARFGRMRSCLSSLSQFIEKFFDDQYPTYKNIVLRAVEAMPKVVKREKTVLSDEQVTGLLNHLLENDKIQEACWISLATASGSRFSELLRFTVDNIDETNLAFDNIFIETLRPIKSKGRTKSGKMIKKYIIKDLFVPYYHKWLVEREKIMKENGKDHDFVFIKKNGDPAEEGSIRSWMPVFEKYLGVPFYAHALRHFTTSFLSRIGLPSILIKEIFSWESELMVSVYDDNEAKDKKWVELSKLKDALDKK